MRGTTMMFFFFRFAAYFYFDILYGLVIRSVWCVVGFSSRFGLVGRMRVPSPPSFIS